MRHAALMLLLAPLAAVAADPPDPASWPCKFCKVETGSSGYIEPAIGYISAPSFHFGDYTGLEDEGMLLDLSGGWRSRDGATASGWDLQADRLLLDSRALELTGRWEGCQTFRIAYDELPHLVARDSQSPFRGDADLSLPSGWTRTGSTRTLPALDSSLSPAWLRTERARAAIGFGFVPARSTDLRFDYRRDEIQGTGTAGGSFLTLSSQLPRHLDQAIDRFDVAAAYRHALGQAQLALASSFFTNDVDSMRWANPYSGPTAGADEGQLAQAPDNRAHQLSLRLASPPGTALQASATLAVGRLEQDDRFLPATTNPSLATTLPRESLDARVDTTLASARLTYSLPWALRLTADGLHDKRDNRTAVSSWQQVVMDSFTGDVRQNAPYSFLRERWRVALERRGPVRVGIGVEDGTRKRRMHDEAETQELKYWLKLGYRPLDGADLRVRVQRAERDGDDLGHDPLALAQNSAARAYSTADRERHEARADLSLGGTLVTTTFNLAYARDDYPATTVGRTAADEFGYGTELAAQPTENLSVSLFASRRLVGNDQAGSQAFGNPDWFVEQEDTSYALGVHAAWHAASALDLGADYVYSGSEGAIAMATGAGETTFPLLVTHWHDARAFARYAFSPALSLRLDLLREIYDAHDWALDGVAADTVGNYLALGQGTQGGSVTAGLVSLRYQFLAEPPADD